MQQVFNEDDLRTIHIAGGTIKGITVRALRRALEAEDQDAVVTVVNQGLQPGGVLGIQPSKGQAITLVSVEDILALLPIVGVK